MKGSRIKYLREYIGLTQPQLADKLKISSSAIAMYETDKREPSDEIKLKMCELFNCSMDYLLGKSEYKNEEEYIKIQFKENPKFIDKEEQEFRFAYHKEMEGLSEEEIADALKFYKEMKKRVNKEKDTNK